MLFDSSIRKELARSLGATLIVLVTVVVTMTLIRTLGLASRGSFNPQDVMLVVSYTVIGFLPNLMNMGLFIAVVMTLSRLYADSEMVIWFSSRIGLASLLRPLLRFAWPVLLGIAVITLLVRPWAKEQVEELRSQYQRRGDLERVQPGQFQESADGTRVFFAEKSDSDELRASNVFVSTNEKDKKTVISARSGHTEIVDGDRVLFLERGQRLEIIEGQAGLRVSEFEHLRMLVEQDPFVRRALDTESRPTLELIRQPTRENLGEITIRLGYALASLNLVVIALAATRVNPRVSRTGNLIFSLLLFQIYLNLLVLGQNWIMRGQISFAAFNLLLHGGMLGGGLLWLAKRHRNWSWWPAGPGWPLRPRTAAKISSP
ncbi:MAG: LPS export ABC transporter permease LptF [Curvibacter sp.]|jgi:lipopolysaccharide export system permease protein|nr:LPS export ABC transporter permease LptF [Curvibacter sp.]